MRAIVAGRSGGTSSRRRPDRRRWPRGQRRGAARPGGRGAQRHRPRRPTATRGRRERDSRCNAVLCTTLRHRGPRSTRRMRGCRQSVRRRDQMPVSARRPSFTCTDRRTLRACSRSARRPSRSGVRHVDQQRDPLELELVEAPAREQTDRLVATPRPRASSADDVADLALAARRGRARRSPRGRGTRRRGCGSRSRRGCRPPSRGRSGPPTRRRSRAAAPTARA